MYAKSSLVLCQLQFVIFVLMSFKNEIFHKARYIRSHSFTPPVFPYALPVHYLSFTAYVNLVCVGAQSKERIKRKLA